MHIEKLMKIKQQRSKSISNLSRTQCGKLSEIT